MPRSPFYKRFIRPPKNFLAYIFIAFAVHFIRILPRRWALSVGSFLGNIYYLFAKKDRRLAIENVGLLRKSYPELPDDLARLSFANAGRNSAVMARIAHDLPRGKLEIDFTGAEGFDRLYHGGKGVIVVTGHIGAFELIPACLSIRGYKVAVVGKRLFDPRLDRLLVSSRSGFEIVNIPSDASARRLLRLLSDGYSLGILADVSTRSVDSVPGKFMGMPASTVVGPVQLARFTGLPLLPMAIYSKPDGTFELRTLDPLEIPRTNDKDSDIATGLRLMNHALEQLVLHDPTQWMWYHPRWR